MFLCIYKHITNICILISNTFQHRVYIKQSEHRGAYACRIHMWPTCWYPNNLIQFDHTMYKGHKFGFQNHQVLSSPVVKTTNVIKVSGPTSVIFPHPPTHQGSRRWNNLIWNFAWGVVTVSVSCSQHGHQQCKQSEMVQVHTTGDIHLHAFHFYSQSGTYG